jgi:hypothetical protein
VRDDEYRREAAQHIQPAERDLDDDEDRQPRGQLARARRSGRSANRQRRPDDQAADRQAHGPMRQVDPLLAAHHGRQERSVHEREVGVGEARMVTGHPGAQQHLREDRDGRDRHQAGQAGPRVCGRHRSMVGALGDEDRGGEHGQGHRQVGGHQLGREPLEHDRRAQQRLHDDENTGDDRGAEQGRVTTAVAEQRDQSDGADQRPDEHRGDQPVAVLDPGMEVGRRDPVAEAERPIRAAQSRVRGAHEAAHGDQDEGRHRSSDRQLGKSGQIGSSGRSRGDFELARP